MDLEQRQFHGLGGETSLPWLGPTLRFQASLSEEDREEFGFDVRVLDWQTYLVTYAQGIRDFLFKEDPAKQVRIRSSDIS